MSKRLGWVLFYSFYSFSSFSALLKYFSLRLAGSNDLKKLEILAGVINKENVIRIANLAGFIP